MNNNNRIIESLHAVVSGNAHHQYEIQSENNHHIDQFDTPRAIIKADSEEFYGLFKVMGQGSFGIVYTALKMNKNRDGSYSKERGDSMKEIVVKLLSETNGSMFELDALEYITSNQIQGFPIYFDQGSVSLEK